MRLTVSVLLFFSLFSSAGLAHELTSAGNSGLPAEAVMPLNLNDATAEQLDELPEIGPALAGRIVAYRDEHGPFTRIEQLDEVKGIGTRILEKLRPLVTIR